MEKLSDSLQEMKNGKAAGYDEITTEQIKHAKTKNGLFEFVLLFFLL